MTKKSLDEKYSYQIDEHNVVHLFRGEEDCQQLLTNPLLSAIFKIESLEKEHTELKCECRRCIHTDCPCVLSDYGKDRNGICDHFKDVFDENIELKEEGKKTFNDWLNACDKYEKVNLKLTKAREIIREFMKYEINEYDGSLEIHFEELKKQAEQFLSEVEK